MDISMFYYGTSLSFSSLDHTWWVFSHLFFVAQHNYLSTSCTTKWFEGFVCHPLRWANHHRSNSMQSSLLQGTRQVGKRNFTSSLSQHCTWDSHLIQRFQIRFTCTPLMVVPFANAQTMMVVSYRHSLANLLLSFCRFSCCSWPS